MARFLRCLILSPRTPLHFRSTAITSLQLSQCAPALVPWSSCSISPQHLSCSLRGLASSSNSVPRVYCSERPLATPRRRVPLRLRRARRDRPPQLDVFICIEEGLPDNPQIQSIAETLQKDVPDAMKVAFESLKDPKYKTRDKSIKNVNKFDKVELSLLLCDDAFIRQLNKEWRDEDKVTDVLSMSQHIPGLAIPILLLGDIVISIDTAARQAEERGHTLIDEIRILMVHGLLHLLGFDHEINCAAEEEMVIEEERVLSSLGWREKGLIKSAYDLVKDEDDLSDHNQQIKKGSTVMERNPKLSHILFDIDGEKDKVLDSDCQVLRKSAESLREAISRGVKLIVVTEKSRAAITRAMDMINLGEYISVSPGIFLHGAVVCGTQGREIYRANLDRDLCCEAFSYSLGHEIPLIAFSGNQCFTLFEHSFADSLHERHYEPKPDIIPSVQHFLENCSIQKITLLGTSSNSSMLHNHMSEMANGQARIVEIYPNLLEIVPLSASKSNGVKILLDHLEISSDEFEIAEELELFEDVALR